MYKIGFCLVLICLCFSVSSCRHFTDEGAADACVDSFSQHYFNWHEEDVKALRAMPSAAKYEVLSLQYGKNDEQMIAKVEVSDFLVMDTLGMAAHQLERAVYVLNLKLRDKRWLVELNQLPQRVK